VIGRDKNKHAGTVVPFENAVMFLSMKHVLGVTEQGFTGVLGFSPRIY